MILKQLKNNIFNLVYVAIALAGIAALLFSFLTKDNLSSVLCGVGTGLLTSLVVSVIINHNNDVQSRKKLEKDKRFILNDIVYYSKDVYIDIIYRINEYLMFQYPSAKYVFRAYEDFKPVNDFCSMINDSDLSHINKEESERLETLLNIGHYRIDHLVSELKRLPKQDYYLSGLLTEKEYQGLLSNNTNDKYLEYAQNATRFWDGEIIDVEKCLTFMKMTLYVCTRVISSIDYCKDSIIKEEENIQNILDQRYFDEIYSNSQEYITRQLEEAELRNQYYEEHPDEFLSLEDESEDAIDYRELNTAIWSGNKVEIKKALLKINKENKDAYKFLTQFKLAKIAMRDKELRKVFFEKYGKKYKYSGNR